MRSTGSWKIPTSDAKTAIKELRLFFIANSALLVGKIILFVGFRGKTAFKTAILGMQIKEIFNRSYTDPYLRAGFHLVFWAISFFASFYFSTISFNSFSDVQATYLLVTKSTLGLMAFYYSLMYFVWPRFFMVRRYLAGALLVLALLLGYAWVDAFFDKLIIVNCNSCMEELRIHNPGFHKFIQMPVLQIMINRLISLGLLYQLMVLLSLPVAIKIGRNYFRQTVNQLRLSRDNLQLEFNFLKSQVNPHFLFNTLNNIYSMVLHNQKEEAAATVARLSGFMRYTLYECNDDQIELEKEVDLFRDYIELERIRMNQTSVQFTFTADNAKYKLPPLLFMPAIENTFKYSNDTWPGSYINMDICANKNILRFRISNMFDPLKKGRPGGIGLANMQKRLQHYYPNRHTFVSSINENIYSLEITCDLS